MDSTSWTCLYAILDLVWDGPAKNAIFAPNLTALQISEVRNTRCAFQPVCRLRLTGKFGWDPFSRLRKIAGILQAPHTRPRVGTNSPTFLGPIFTILYRIYQNQCCCFKYSRLAVMLDLVWAGPPQKWHFSSQSDHLYRFRKFEHTFSIAEHLSSAWKIWLRFLQLFWETACEKKQ